MHRIKACVLVMCLSVCNSALSAEITWFGPAETLTSNATWPAVGSGQPYTSNFGVAFQTGGSSTFTMDWVQLQLNTATITSGSASLNIALRDATSATPYVGVAGTTEYALDTVSFSMPTTISTNFTLNLTAADIPNITAFAMNPSTTYTLIVYAPSVSIGMQRRTGYLNGTTNSFYTVSNGFLALDTFRDNTANYTNNTNSFPTLGISFGETVVPEPSAWALSGIAMLVLGLAFRRKGERGNRRIRFSRS